MFSRSSQLCSFCLPGTTVPTDVAWFHMVMVASFDCSGRFAAERRAARRYRLPSSNGVYSQVDVKRDLSIVEFYLVHTKNCRCDFYKNTHSVICRQHVHDRFVRLVTVVAVTLQQRGSHRPQTPPLVLPPGKLKISAQKVVPCVRWPVTCITAHRL